MHSFEERSFLRFSLLGIWLAFGLAPSALPAQPLGPAGGAPLAPSDASPVVTQAPAVSPETRTSANSETKPPGQIADAPEVAASTPAPGYVRLEDDYLSGFQVYAGVTYPLGHSIGLAAGIYLAENYPALQIGDANIPTSLSQSWWSEFDLGPSITIGPLSLTLEGGIAFDFASKRATALNAPQLYTTVDFAKFHFESWIWTILYSPFDTPSNDYVHARNWLLYKASGAFSIGPELEFNINLQGKHGKSGLVSLPVGGRVELAFGASSIALFLGYQTDKDSRGANDQAAVGRFALIHNF